MSSDIEERLLILISKAEAHFAQFDRLDEMIAQVAATERRLADVAWKLAAAKLTGSLPAAFAAGILGGAITTYIILGATLGMHP